jgi:L-rhamnose mutarotase
VLNRFISKPGNEYWHVMKRVINYYVLGIENYDIFLYKKKSIMYYFKDFNDVDWNTLKYIYKIKISTRLENS